MISFKDQKDQIPSIFAILGIAMLAGALGLILMPARSVEFIVKKANQDKIRVYRETKIQSEKADEMEAFVMQRKWQTERDQIPGAVLARFSKLIEANRLRMVSFRPQRTVETETVLQLPFLVTVDGTFASVMNLVKALDQLETKFVLTTVQISSSEDVGDSVTSTIGVTVFRDPKSAENPSDGDSSTAGAAKASPAKSTKVASGPTVNVDVANRAARTEQGSTSKEVDKKTDEKKMDGVIELKRPISSESKESSNADTKSTSTPVRAKDRTASAGGQNVAQPPR